MALPTNWTPKALVPATENNPFTLHELQQVITTAPNFSSPGPDAIPYTIWKLLSPESLNILLDAFNSLSEKNFPEDLAKSVLTLLFKTGDAKDVKNYRPISLLNTDWKLLSSIIWKRLSPTIAQNVSLAQSGYMPNRWCLNGVFRI